jgi:hypothetical protein
MKSRVWVLSTLVLAGVLLSSSVMSQEQGPGGPSPEQMQKMMAAWQKAATPGEHHAKLEHFIGEWDLETKFWMAGPDGPASTSKGSAKYEWILGKRFVQETMRARTEMAPGQVMEIEGLGITGYDNMRNMYTSIWMDNTNTHLLDFVGSMSPDGKKLTFYGDMDEPGLDVYGRTIKSTIRVVDKNTHVFALYDLHAGDDYKVMEITYKRKR